MKLKGVSWFEQNVEKVVLSGVSVIFLGVVAMQFLYEPNKIKVGTDAPRSPGTAFEPVLKKAQGIRGKMDAKEGDLNLPPIPKIDLAEQFEARHNNPVAPADSLIAFGPGAEVKGAQAMVNTPTGEVRFQLIAVPAPVSAVASSFRNTIDPTEAVAYPELKKLLPAEQPMDKAAVSVEARFDGTALKSALLAKDADGKSSPIPAGWWRDQVEIVGVKLERQEQSSDGAWGAEVQVPAAPGRGIPGLLKNAKSLGDMPDILGTARAAADDIQRPAYYHVLAGGTWKPPADAVKGNDGANIAEIRKLMESRKRDLKEQDGINKSIENLTKQGSSPRLPVPTGGGGGGGGGKGSSGGGGGNQAPAPDPKKEEAAQAGRLKQLQGRLKTVEDRLTKNEESLKVLGVDVEGNPLPLQATTPAAATTPGGVPTAKGLLDSSDVRLWAHDLTVQPGKAYRYRVKVLVNNPAFGRSAGLVADQQDMAKVPAIESAASEWTEPVNVLADKYYFITTATEGDAQSPSRATAELYQFFYGYYRKSSVYLEPGDVLGVQVKLPDPVKLPIYDLSKLAAADPSQPAAAPQPGGPILPPSLRQGGKGGGGRGGQVNEGGGGQGPVPPQQADKPQLPTNAKPWSTPVRADFDVYMLDVAKIPGETGAKVQAYLRGETGKIIIRNPADDDKADTYRILAASAKEGENQGQAAAPVVDPKKPEILPNQPVNPRDPRNNPPPPPGGGGGGGG